MTENTDVSATLYNAYLCGNDYALEQLVKLHGDSLTRFAYCIVRDDDCAEDVTADTFATLITKRKKFRGEGKFRTYLYTIARNRAIDYVRKRGRNVPITGLENMLSGEDGEQSLITADFNASLYRAMQLLPDMYREVLYLSYFTGFTVHEICHRLKKSAKQVYNLLARAKSTLKNILVKEGFAHEN